MESANSKCQFCFVFFNDPAKTVEHINLCIFRFSETFIAFDNRIKFACTVCRDVFVTRNELEQHEKQHLFPGSFVCSSCGKVFQNETDRMKHEQIVHKKFECQHCVGLKFIGDEIQLVDHCEKEHNSENGRFALCSECGANFEQKSFLRVHKETRCGQLRSWNCFQCAPLLSSEDAYNKHMTIHASNMQECENDKTNSDSDRPIKTEIVSIDMEVNEVEAPMENTCSVYIEDPIFLSIKHEDQLNAEQCRDADELEGDEDSFDESDDEPDATIIPKFMYCDNNEIYNEEGNDNASNSIRKPFKCGICAATFATEAIYKIHVNSHDSDENLTHKCSCCYLQFVSVDEMLEHQKQIHLDELKCRLCHKFFMSPKQLEDHVDAKHNDGVDDSEFLTTSEIDSMTSGVKSRDLMYTDEGYENDSDNKSIDNECADIDGGSGKATRKPFECARCGAGFIIEDFFKKHIALHGPDGNWIVKCTCCRLYFATVKKMKEHRYQQHLDEIKCGLGNKIYTCPAEQKKHMRAKHNIGKRRKYYREHECSKCDFKTRNRDLLEVHMADSCERILLFKCKLCNAAFDSDQNLKTHRLTHDERACELCGKVYATIAQLISHRKIHEEKMFTCEYCSKSFLLHVVYLKHLSAHTGVNPFKCSTCSKRFLKIVERDNHEKNGCDQVTGNVANDGIGDDNIDDVTDPSKIKWKLPRKRPMFGANYECKICSEKFVRESSLSKHLSKHGPNGELIHKCKCCAKLFRSKAETSKHMTEMHGHKLNCSFCERTFNTPESRRYHMQAHHGYAGPVHICSKCGAEYLLKSVLEDHERSNCGRNPFYSCDICGSRFLGRHNFNKHMKKHTDSEAGKETFTCETCGKILRSKSNLNAHMMIHTGEKPYTCSYCGKAFRAVTDYKHHELAHEGVKLYKCDGCEKRFTCNSNLVKHRRARKDTCGLVPLQSLRVLNGSISKKKKFKKYT